MPITKDKSVGIILYCKFPRSLKFLILKHKKGHWSFAKGHRDKGESTLDTTKRELFEEAGIKNVDFDISVNHLVKISFIHRHKECVAKM